jgi:hypothetical protein
LQANDLEGAARLLTLVRVVEGYRDDVRFDQVIGATPESTMPVLSPTG